MSKAAGVRVRNGVEYHPWREGDPGHDGWRWIDRKIVRLEPKDMAVGWRTSWQWKRLPPTKESLDKARAKWKDSRKTIAMSIRSGRNYARMWRDPKKLAKFMEAMNGTGEAT